MSRADAGLCAGIASLADDSLQACCRSEDGNALVVATEAVQVLVAGDDEVGTGSKGAGEDVIVVGVRRDYAGHVLRGDHVGEATKFGDDTLRCQASLREARGELLA